MKKSLLQEDNTNDIRVAVSSCTTERMSQSFYTECSSPSYLFQPVSATEKDNEKFKACKKTNQTTQVAVSCSMSEVTTIIKIWLDNSVSIHKTSSSSHRNFKVERTLDCLSSSRFSCCNCNFYIILLIELVKPFFHELGVSSKIHRSIQSISVIRA